MADNRTIEQRRATMQAVKGKDTKPELIVRKLLFKLGYRYRLHAKKLPAKPDIVFAGRKKAILIHGCFWHGHGCKVRKPPKSRLDYWLPKIEENKKRDANKLEQLKALGWKTLTLWGCELENERKLTARLQRFLDGA